MEYKVTRYINGKLIADEERESYSLCNDGVRAVVQEFYRRIENLSEGSLAEAENLKMSTLS